MLITRRVLVKFADHEIYVDPAIEPRLTMLSRAVNNIRSTDDEFALVELVCDLTGWSVRVSGEFIAAALDDYLPF